MNKQGLRKSILETHNKVPYHNYSHAKRVGNNMMELEGSRDFISPGRMAGYLHDAGHTGTANSPYDEIRSCEIAHDLLVSRGYDKDYIETVKELIMGTIFSERGNLKTYSSMLLADSDLSNLGRDYTAFIRNSIGMLLEGVEKGIAISDEEIVKNFRHDTPIFFKSLTDITGDDSTPFLTKKARKLFPNFSKNKDTLAQNIQENPREIIQLVRHIEATPSTQFYRKTTA